MKLREQAGEEKGCFSAVHSRRGWPGGQEAWRTELAGRPGSRRTKWKQRSDNRSPPGTGLVQGSKGSTPHPQSKAQHGAFPGGVLTETTRPLGASCPQNLETAFPMRDSVCYSICTKQLVSDNQKGTAKCPPHTH